MIITIIIMLILVGVTINFALNGGIIQKAKQASAQSQLQADREALFSAVVGSLGLDGEVDFATLNSEVIKIGFTGTNGTYTSAAGNTFTVDKYGNITSSGESSGSNADLAYLQTLVGKSLEDVMEDTSGMVFKDPNIMIDYIGFYTLIMADEINENGENTLPIIYKGKVYDFTIEGFDDEALVLSITENSTKNTNTDLVYLRTFIGKQVSDITTKDQGNNIVFNDSEITFSDSYSGTPTEVGEGLIMIIIDYKGNDYSVGLAQTGESIDDYIVYIVEEGILDLGEETPTATD